MMINYYHFHNHVTFFLAGLFNSFNSFLFHVKEESIWPGLCLLKCIASIVFIILDASYVDPLGPQIQRPKTAARKRTEEDEFADEELGDDLLPE